MSDVLIDSRIVLIFSSSTLPGGGACAYILLGILPLLLSKNKSH
jgi:hypothetical protein